MGLWFLCKREDARGWVLTILSHRGHYLGRVEVGDIQIGSCVQIGGSMTSKFEEDVDGKFKNNSPCWML
jgi:hypothetical protein